MAPLPQFLLLNNNDYTPPAFINTFAIKQMHRIPRGSRSNDAVALIIGTRDEQSDYLWGVIAFTAFSFAIYVAWTLLLLVLKLCGNRRAGLFSGNPPRMPLPPQGYASDLLLNSESNANDGGASSEENVTSEENIEDSHAEKNKGDEVTRPALGSSESQEKSGNSDGGDSSPSFEVKNIMAESKRDSKILFNRSALADEQNATESDEGAENQVLSCDATFAKYEADVKRHESLVFWTRMMAIAAAIGAFCSSVVFINEGVVKLASTLDAGIDGMQGIHGFIQQGIDIIDNFNINNDNLTHVVRNFNETISETGWCPLKRDDFIAECEANKVPEEILDQLNITNCTVTGLPFQDELDFLWNLVTKVEQNLRKEISNIEQDLYELQDIIDYLVPRANSLRWAFYVSASFAVLVDLVMFVLLYGVYLAWQRKLSKPFICIRSFLVVPIFLFLVFLVWLFAIIFCFGAVLTADFCVGGPNSRLLEILTKQKDTFSSVTFDLMTFYLTDCTGPAVSFFSRDTAVAVSDTLNGVHDLLEALIALDEDRYIEECGVDISPLTFIAESLHTSFHIVAEAFSGVHQLFLCSNFFPVYEKIAYNAMCYLGTSALRNVFVSLLLNLIFDLVFITFRAAWQEDNPNLTNEEKEEPISVNSKRVERVGKNSANQVLYQEGSPTTSTIIAESRETS